MIGEEPSTLPLFYIDVFTSSKEELDYSVMIEPVDNFTLEWVDISLFLSLSFSLSLSLFLSPLSV